MASYVELLRHLRYFLAALNPLLGGVSNGPRSIYRLIITNHPPRPATAIFLKEILAKKEKQNVTKMIAKKTN